MKFIATATRKNINGKPDYVWVYTYTNKTPVLFETEEEALDCAKAHCEDHAYGLYAPKAIPAIRVTDPPESEDQSEDQIMEAWQHLMSRQHN